MRTWTLAMFVAWLLVETPNAAITLTDSGVTVEPIVSLDQIERIVRDTQWRFWQLVPPATDDPFYLHPERVVRVVDWDSKAWPKPFLKQMHAEMGTVGNYGSMYPLYRLTVKEDRSEGHLGDTVFCNSYGQEVWRIFAPKDYNPYLFAFLKYGVESADELTAMQRIFGRSSNVGTEIVLIPEIFASQYEADAAMDETAMRLAIEPTVSTEYSMVEASVPAPPGGGGSTNTNVTASAVNVVVTNHFHVPEGFGSYAEIFQCTNLPSASWAVAVNKMAVTAGTDLAWTDLSSSNVPVRFYILSDADILGGADSDGDGYSDGREFYVTGTNPNEFDFRDEDEDGIHDWYETMLFGNITNQAGTNDLDGDSLQNAAEMELTTSNVVFHSDPSLVDTDGDGMDDAYETVHEFLDPFDPFDAEQDEDHDGTSNFDEYTNNTDPGDSQDGGDTNVMVDVTLTLGEPEDTSAGRKLWGYKLEISGDQTFTLYSPSGQIVTSSIKLMKGTSYDVKLERLGFEYTVHGYDDAGGLVAQASGTNVVANGVLEEGLNLFGTNDHWSAGAYRLDELFLENDNVLTAKVHVVKVELEEGSSLTADPTSYAILNANEHLSIQGNVEWYVLLRVTPVQAKSHVVVRLIQSIKGIARVELRNPSGEEKVKDASGQWYFDGKSEYKGDDDYWEDFGEFYRLSRWDYPTLGSTNYSEVRFDYYFEDLVQYKLDGNKWTTLKKGSWETHGHGLRVSDGQGGFTGSGETTSTVTSPFSDSTETAVENPDFKTVTWEP